MSSQAIVIAGSGQSIQLTSRIANDAEVNTPVSKKRLDEYLRRNLLVCAAIGATAGLEECLERISAMRRPPKWLIESLEGVLERARRVRAEMVARRDDIRPKERSGL